MLKPIRLLGCAALLALIAGGASKAANDQNPQLDAAWRSVVARFEQRLSDEQVVGGAIVFTGPGGEPRSAFFGVQDAGTGVPVDENTIFHWASITKTFTAIAAMQLVERGLLDLDAPAVKYLPELRAVHNPFGPIEDVHVIHLITHTAGFRSPTWPWGGDQPWHPHEPTQWSQLVAMMPYTEVEFRPGERFLYSNPGYTFLGRIIEIVSGEDIEAYIDKNVLRPLGMHTTYFDMTPSHLKKHRSNNYYLVDGKPVANGIDFDTGITNANGGLNASIADMTRYVRFLSGVGPREGSALNRSALQAMWQPVAEVAREPGVIESMGRGFFVLDFDAGGGAAAQRFIGHTGTQMGFRSFIYVDPQTGSAALIALNTRTTENYRGLYAQTRRDIFESLFGKARNRQGFRHSCPTGVTGNQASLPSGK